MDETQALDSQESIAIIGMSGRFPGAGNLDKFWRNLRDGVESITFFSDKEALASGTDPSLLRDPKFVKAHGVLDDIEMFDASFFDMSPRDAKFLDPQHRIFLESSWEAMENSGYNPENYPGRIGVFAGTSFSTYLLRNILPNKLINFPTSDRLDMALTNHKDTMPMRVSFHMNLTGPSISIGTTCSTSLVAIHLACQSLLTYQSDMALAGSSFLRVPPMEGYLYQEGMIYSPDGHIRTFDADAKGIVTGAGVGTVLLKRLEEAIADGDFIHAVIKASALNNDGSTKIGYTAPSSDGQAEAIAEAISMAGIDSETITYIEAHGTGTELGDPVEIEALTKAFRMTSSQEGRPKSETQKRQFCGVGSSKPNIGHLNHAAGMAGLLKAVLALKHKQLPPTLNFKKPNPQIDFENSPFYVNSTLKDWQPPNGIPRRAGVNAFGIGGTNGHVVLEEAPTAAHSGTSRPCHIIMISAKTPSALDTMTDNLGEHLEQNPGLNMADVAYTLQSGRKEFNCRRIMVCSGVEEGIKSLKIRKEGKTFFTSLNKPENRSVVFMFSGQGSQYLNMAKEIYLNEALFRETFDLCSEILKPILKLDLRDIIYPAITEGENSDITQYETQKIQLEEAATHKLCQTAITQPALFVIEYALARLWQGWGVHPEAMIGHSIGEYVAACLAGVFSLEDALLLVAARGSMIQEQQPGAMVAISISPEELAPLLNSKGFPERGISLAVVNSPSQCVVSGESEAITELVKELDEKRIPSKSLRTSHAFHSQMMDPLVAPFTELVKKVQLNPPQIPYLSNVTGTWITEQEATDPKYWASHLRQTVRFSDGLKNLLQNPEQILLEVGPGRTLGTLARQHPARSSEQIILTSLRHPSEASESDTAFILKTLGRLWLSGKKVDWPEFYKDELRCRIPLPTYPFERKRHWIDPPKPEHGIQSEEEKLSNTLLVLNADDSYMGGEMEANSDFLQESALGEAPRNDKEQRIAAIWIDILGVESVAIHENFFELGGSSLTASKLVAKLNQSLHTDLSIRQFLSAPTIAEIAELLERVPSKEDTVNPEPEPSIYDKGREKSKDMPSYQPKIAPSSLELPSSLIRLKNGDTKQTPIFLVHPIDGYVYFYRDLVSTMKSERSVYGFQARGLEGECSPFTTIEEMAAQYIRDMGKIQKSGPYIIGGFSFGGIVAFEIAHQLRESGEKIKFLFMVDTPATGGEDIFGLTDDEQILIFIFKNLLNLKLDSGSISIPHLKSVPFEEQVSYLLELSEDREKLPADFGHQELQNLTLVIKANTEAMASYKPNISPDRFSFFRAMEPWKNRTLHHPEYFWIEYAGAGIEIDTVPGNHMTMNYPPHVKVLAKKLDIAIIKS